MKLRACLTATLQWDGISTSVMTYGEHTLQGGEQKASIGPCASGAGIEPERPALTPFLRPGPEILTEAIPVFFIGRNRDGFWIARDADGKSGGLFWRRETAIRFAKRSTWPATCATIFPSERIELDLDNQGNPFVTPVATIARLLTHQARRLIAVVQKAARR